MRIEHISDTHGFHNQLQLKGADILIHTGDATNYRDQYRNHNEFLNFFSWFREISSNYLLTMFIPGNHDSYIFENESLVKKMFEDVGIEFMHKREVIVDGLKFYGDSIMPRFGDWCYMTDRSKTNKHWEQIPIDTNVLLTHTPPKGILDLSERRDRTLEFCGDSALLKRVQKLPELKAHLYGHIHDNNDCKNNGIINRDNVIFSNASCVVDGKFDKGIINHGNILTI